MTTQSPSPFIQEKAFEALKQKMDCYYPISNNTWEEMRVFCECHQLNKHDVLYPCGEVPQSFAFVYQGLFRAFNLNENGHEFNKTFFYEGRFPGSMTALHSNSPTQMEVDALENAIIITINFKKYRELLYKKEDLKLFQIIYLEQNWLLIKDARENQIVQEDASQRYIRFCHEYPDLHQRLTQYHIASHLGITPTQLSRIRKNI